MKVAIDSGPLTGGHSVRGVGVSIKGLIDALGKYNTESDIVVEPVDFSSSNLSGFDIVHYTSFNPYFYNIPRLGSVNGKIVLTIHDLIPVIYKEHYPPGIRGEIKFQHNKFLVKKADAIITVSETSKKDIVRIFGIDPDKITVVYWAADEIFKNVSENHDFSEIRKLYKLPREFVLYVGDVNYNKNLPTLIKACKLIDIPLVIVGKSAVELDELVKRKVDGGPRDIIRSLLGKPHPETEHFKRLLSLIKNNKVVTTGYVPAIDLVKIFSMAKVYCQPSYYEGFGIPVLEAFSCEIPVVISKTQALVEIAGEAALKADPNSPEDFAGKISSLLKDTTEKLHLIRAGKTRSKQYSWESTAHKTVNVYKGLFEK